MSDDFDFCALEGKGKEEDFVIFEKAMRKIYNLERKEDRNGLVLK